MTFDDYRRAAVAAGDTTTQAGAAQAALWLRAEARKRPEHRLGLARMADAFGQMHINRDRAGRLLGLAREALS